MRSGLVNTWTPLGRGELEFSPSILSGPSIFRAPPEQSNQQTADYDQSEVYENS